ncbi:hypothetical protein cypCar_00040279 [Cyprinus carpio]|nr:hypothetical protein cypCar_00040279 [Cyprinus carpio]
MGGSGSKTKGVWPFSGSGAGGEAPGEVSEQCLARLRGSKNTTPFVFTRRRESLSWITLESTSTSLSSCVKYKHGKWGGVTIPQDFLPPLVFF